MSLISAFVLFLSIAACGTNLDSRSTGQISPPDEANDCCAHWSADRKCLHEEIPGCAKANIQRTNSPDSCCAHWSADGKCIHELIQGCSDKM